ncbi:uncharacterized protein C8R40DRAFT_632968 [Lentinula edodes]|uniref:uncharacterized protein n=1 Tax=Lentinula edodes TaxID=5353 RepID=UPI001E8D0174|nr:uncharacterized protein C8R40DRAFT_632968 [Lentinula edodes]KAH7870588.1 hypothetical protein C8R40DRAFT_632968 [Lentinula edodes]
MEKREYLFGALRNDPDAFTDAFISGIRERPNLFQVVLHSDTDPGQRFECFGSGNEALPAIQMRTFEALPPSINNHPLGAGKWQVQSVRLCIRPAYAQSIGTVYLPPFIALHIHCTVYQPHAGDGRGLPQLFPIQLSIYLLTEISNGPPVWDETGNLRLSHKFDPP